jgi:hypothetical protein
LSTSNRNTKFTGPCSAAKNRSLSSGSTCKQSTSRQYVESSNCSTANYDSVQWCSI